MLPGRPLMLVAGGVMLVILAAGITAWRTAGGDDKSAGSISPDARLARQDGFAPPATIAQDTANADAVIVGHVKAISAARWSTADGKRPRTSPGDAIIYRTATVEVWEVLSGTVERRTITVTVEGGEVEGEEMHVADGPPQLREDETLVLFALAPADASARAFAVAGNWDTLVKYVLGASGSVLMSDLRAGVAAARK